MFKIRLLAAAKADLRDGARFAFDVDDPVAREKFLGFGENSISDRRAVLAATDEPGLTGRSKSLRAGQLTGVLQLLAEGVGNKVIATRLNISEHTVKFHISSVLSKMGAASRTEAVTQGIRNGLILI